MTNTRTTWHHATDLNDDDMILSPSTRLGIKWFAAPECARDGSPTGYTARNVVVELPRVAGVPVIDTRDVAGSLAGVDHDLTDDQIEAVLHDLDRGDWEGDAAAAWLMNELTGGRGLVLLHWEGEGDTILIVGEAGLIGAEIVADLPVEATPVVTGLPAIDGGEWSTDDSDDWSGDDADDWDTGAWAF